MGLLSFSIASFVAAGQGLASTGPGVQSELPATADATQGPEGYNSPGLAEDPSEPRFLALAARLDGRDFGCSLQLSGDSGRTWVPAAPVASLPRGAEKCYAPEVAIDGRGTLYYLFVGLRGRGNVPMGAFLTSSRDRGRTFAPVRKILGPHNFQVRMGIDPERGRHGRIHLVWLKALQPPGIGSLPAAPNPILASFSDDGGRSFSEPARVSDPAREKVVAPALAVGPDGEVWAVYYDLREDARDYHGLEGPTWNGKWDLVATRWEDRRARFTRGVRVAEVTPPGRVALIFTMPPPALAVPHAGSAIAAWTDARHGDPDVLASRSDEVGRVWGNAVRVNDDSRGNGRTQDLPRIAAAPGGRVDALFYDRRRDDGDLLNDVYLTSSRDGSSFQPNVKINSRNFSSLIGRRYGHPSAAGLVEFGSRMGLVSRERSAVAAWTDTRNSTHPLEQHIFTATVARPSSVPRTGVPGGSIGIAVAAVFSLALLFLTVILRVGRNKETRV